LKTIDEPDGSVPTEISQRLFPLSILETNRIRSEFEEQGVREIWLLRWGRQGCTREVRLRLRKARKRKDKLGVLVNEKVASELKK
jgi:hypothetical protein